MVDEQIFSGSKTIKELFKFINKNFITKELQKIKKQCINCLYCYHEFDGEYGEIDCGYYCQAVEYEHKINSDKRFPYKKAKDCFVLSDMYTNGYCIWCVINECKWLEKEQQDKIYKHFMQKQDKYITIV